MDEKKKDLIPVAAIALFLVMIIIICAVRLSMRDKQREQEIPAETVSYTQTEETAEDGMTQTQEADAEDSVKTEETAKTENTAQVKENESDSSKQTQESDTAKNKNVIFQDHETQLSGNKITEKKENAASIPADWKIPEGSVSSNNPYAGIEGVKKTNEEMLVEMASYWEEGHMEAVEDLAGLAWYRKMSDSIVDQNTFYYYGERNASGQPHGIGLAVYADHEYYYGSWADGKRQGQGEWFKKYVYYDNDTVSDRAYQVHMYMGEWANDLPNGFGQEHVDLNMSQAAESGYYIQNVIGTFKDGLYSGEMYLTTLDNNGTQEEWNGLADMGIWSPYGSGTNKIEVPVCRNSKDEDHYLWLAVRDNKDRGITQLLE